MPRRILLAAAALAALAAPAAAPAHSGNPDMLSRVLSVTPPTEGVTLEVLNRDDALELVNRSGQDVVVMGYEKDPYARVLADGTVQVNRRSSATYLNEERFAGAEVPAIVDKDAPPEWRTLNKTGRFDWHDHRMHYMVEDQVPPQVKDRDVHQKVNDWSVPISIGGREGAIGGELLWTPQDTGGGVPVPAIAGLVVLVAGGAAAVVAARRRRGAGEPDEAW